MEKVNRRYLIISITITMILAVLVATYAYWRGAIQGEGSSMSVELGDAKVIFTDNTIIGNVDIVPGWSVTKTFTIENQGGTTFKYDIYLKDLINTMVTEDFLQYKITSNNNGYNMDDYASIPKSPVESDFDLATNVSIDAGVTQTYTIEFRYVDSPTVNQNEDMGKKFGGQLMIRENTDKTLYSILSDGKKYTVGERGTFDAPFGGETIKDGYNQTGTIYKTEDNNDYYFAGNPSDNWVKFAGLWWRIIRTNSTEGTRLLYAGTSHDGQDGFINNTTYVWNSSYDAYTYVYWSNSTFKSTLNSWYSSNITGTNDNMVNSIVYCNDTSYTNQSSWGTNGRSYGAYNRLYTNKAPSHTCGTNNFGSAAKVGLMTADEVVYAGGNFGYNSPNTYYYRSSKASGCTGTSGDPCSVTGDNHWWTLSPFYFLRGYAWLFFVHGANGGLPGYLGSNNVTASNAVRPVITLKPDVIVTGEGTTDSPYEVKKEKKSFYTTLTNGETYTVDETRNTSATSPIEGTSITQGYNHTGKIYKTGEDYYFAGNPSDNWVKFADKWWRIIRTNSTEGTRLLYAGTSHDGQDGYINNTDYVWNSTYNAYTYVYWSNASFKDTLNNWYTSNISGPNDNIVNSVVYCNDTSIASTSGSNQYFGAHGRLINNKAPSHSCGTNSFGPASKVGMMTADEVVFAGGVYRNNAPNTYYYRNSKSNGCVIANGDPCSVTANHHWWTISPFAFSSGNSYVFNVLGASNSGYLDSAGIHGSAAIRPVITLAPNIKITGSGTTDDPYVPTL